MPRRKRGIELSPGSGLRRDGIETLAQRAESTKRLLVDAAKTPYPRKPIPDQVDHAVSGFLEAYLAAVPADRAGAAAQVGQDSASAEMLTVYSGRMAAQAVRTASTHYLQLAVAAVMLAPEADFQEFTWTLAVLYDAAKRIGGDPHEIFAEITSLEPSGERVMQIFRWTPEQRRLKHDRPVMASDGFRYESDLKANSS